MDFHLTWDLLEHLLMLSTIAGLLWARVQYVRKVARRIDASVKKTDVMWRDHEYSDWDGTERRNDVRPRLSN
jgi:hypothetical protein